MVELVTYLQENGFKVFLCTGSTRGFARVLAADRFGILPERVIGTTTLWSWEEKAEGADLVRGKRLFGPANVHGGKPVHIQAHIGQRPVLAVGNSDGDLEMLRFVAGGKRPHLNLVLRHDDAEREYAYTEGAEKILEWAEQRHWSVISFKRDFRWVFRCEREHRCPVTKPSTAKSKPGP
jgi:phosphoserine phosphatase